jgi:hypothetical protein
MAAAIGAEPNVQKDCGIKLAALGRRFALGQFYDYRTDTVLTGLSFLFLINR